MPEPGALTLTSPQSQRRRGRPKGATNKRSADLARYIEATYGGQTPGQQSAAIALVKPTDLKHAKRLAKEMGIIDIDLPPLMLAMVVKAAQLGRALGIGRADAWVLMAKERAELMGYIHQKMPAQSEDKAKELPTVFYIPGDSPTTSLPSIDGEDQPGFEIIEDFSGGRE